MALFFQDNLQTLIDLTVQHMAISLLAVFIAFVIGVPLAIVMTRYKSISYIGLNIVNVLYTIPSLALFGLMIPVIGTGTVPALVALILYSLLPIVQNTYVGIKNIDESIIEAAKGMGMDYPRILFKIEIPLSLTVIIAGLRTALVNSIGITTIAAYIGAGGLGVLVFRGISSVSTPLIILGSLPILLLAILCDSGLKEIEERLSLAHKLGKRMNADV
jgi:osmoprotectant transport system permease protein